MLGYWKKIVHIMDKANSLAVCYTYGDFKNYLYVFDLFDGPKEKYNFEKFSPFEVLKFEAPET